MVRQTGYSEGPQYFGSEHTEKSPKCLVPPVNRYGTTP